MKTLLVSPDRLFIHQAKALLDAEGIDCLIDGEERSGLAGAVPAQDCWVSLRILDDGQEERARQILAMPLPEPTAGFLKCPQCGERIDPALSVCWKCAKPSAEAVQHPNVYEALAAAVRALLLLVGAVLSARGGLHILVPAINPSLMAPVPLLESWGQLAAGLLLVRLWHLRRGRRNRDRG